MGLWDFVYKLIEKIVEAFQRGEEPDIDKIKSEIDILREREKALRESLEEEFGIKHE